MNTAIILAAGKGTRMQADINKQFLILRGRPVISHTLQVFDNHPSIHEIILVINPLEEETISEKLLIPYDFKKRIKIIHGGSERQESVYNGLSEVDPSTSIVLIHDGARPLVTDEVLQRCILGAEEYGAVAVGVPAKETIKIVTKDQFVDYTPRREELWITQTPQAFHIDIIKKAHELANMKQVLGTDDAMLVEQMAHRVKMVMGDYENIKITTPEDLLVAEGILRYRNNNRGL